MCIIELPLSTNLLAVALLLLSYVSSSAFINLIGMYYSLYDSLLGMEPRKVFELGTDCSQLILIAILFYSTILKSNATMTYIWIWLQSAMTIFLTLRLPILMIILFPNYYYTSFWDMTALYVFSRQILCLYLTWLTLLMYRLMRSKELEENIRPFGNGFTKLWKYYTQDFPGFGTTVLLIIEMVWSFTISVDVGYHLLCTFTQDHYYEMYSPDPQTIESILIRLVRLFMAVYGIVNIAKNKQKSLRPSMSWMAIYLSLLIFSSSIFCYVIVNSIYVDGIDKTFNDVFMLSYIFVFLVDIIFRFIICASVWNNMSKFYTLFNV